MKLVYIAGPYRAATPWLVEQNVRRAEEIGLTVATVGGMPVVPHSMCRFYDKQCSDVFWTVGTMELMRRCDIVVVAPGWQFSEGTQGELALATKLSKPLFYYGELHLFERLAEALLA
jgi:hypothetical protein